MVQALHGSWVTAAGWLAKINIPRTVAPSVIAASHLASGALVPMLPTLDFGAHLFVLTWPKALQLSGRIRTFVELAAGVADNENLD